MNYIQKKLKMSNFTRSMRSIFVIFYFIYCRIAVFGSFCNCRDCCKDFLGQHEDNSTRHVKIDKLLGVKIYQKEYHYFSIVNYNGIWYNKNTLQEEQCKKMTVPEILKLFN